VEETKKREHLFLRFDRETYDKVTELSKSEERTKTAILRRAIADYATRTEAAPVES